MQTRLSRCLDLFYHWLSNLDLINNYCLSSILKTLLRFKNSIKITKFKWSHTHPDPHQLPFGRTIMNSVGGGFPGTCKPHTHIFLLMFFQHRYMRKPFPLNPQKIMYATDLTFPSYTVTRKSKYLIFILHSLIPSRPYSYSHIGHLCFFFICSYPLLTFLMYHLPFPYWLMESLWHYRYN